VYPGYSCRGDTNAILGATPRIRSATCTTSMSLSKLGKQEESKFGSPREKAGAKSKRRSLACSAEASDVAPSAPNFSRDRSEPSFVKLSRTFPGPFSAQHAYAQRGSGTPRCRVIPQLDP
jgi:hypothetical protein